MRGADLTFTTKGGRAVVVNPADDRGSAHLNSVHGAPDVLQEIRRDTIDTLLRVARKDPVLKVRASYDGITPTVAGYVTFQSQIAGSTASQLEGKLGFKAGALAKGAYVFVVDHLALNAGNIAPRGDSRWSAGVTPRDLDTLSQRAGVPVEYDPDYPPATSPVIQFTILAPVPFIGAPRFIGGNATV